VVLEAAGEKVSLVLLDGSPAYVLTHQNAFKNRHSNNKVDDRDAFAYFVLLFKELDYQVVRDYSFLMLFNKVFVLCMYYNNKFILNCLNWILFI